MYEYRCTILKVIDGDTVDVDIDLGFGIWVRNERVRMYGIDTPESRTRDLLEKKYGLLAKDFLKKSLPKTCILKTHRDEKGKFGRILGEFILENGSNVNQLMIDNHMAVDYWGRSKEDIKEQHLRNREILDGHTLIVRGHE